MSIWFNYDRVKTITENVAGYELENKQNPQVEADLKEQEKNNKPEDKNPKGNHEQNSEKKLEKLVLDFLKYEEQLDGIGNAIENSDYKNAVSLLKKLYQNSDNQEIADLINELEALEVSNAVNLFPGDSIFLKWIKPIFSLDFVQDSKTIEKKKKVLQKLESLKLNSAKILKQNMKQ